MYAAVGAMVSFVALIASRILAADTNGTSGFDFAVYGVSGTTIAILLFFVKTLWSEIKDLRQENSLMATTAIEKVTVVATQASSQLAESAKALEAATGMMHTLAGRGLGTEQLTELNYHLRALREQRQPPGQ